MVALPISLETQTQLAPYCTRSQPRRSMLLRLPGYLILPILFPFNILTA
jgi:hypothetical protein